MEENNEPMEGAMEGEAPAEGGMEEGGMEGGAMEGEAPAEGGMEGDDSQGGDM